MSKFKIYYDSTPDSVVDTISALLKEYGITITASEEETDGYIEYTIAKENTNSLMKVVDIKHLQSIPRLQAGGTYITFLSDTPFDIDSYVDVTIEKRTHHFKVSSFNIKDGYYQIEAVEAGYWARKIDNQSDFDLRKVLGLDVVKVIDEKQIQQINTESCWC